MRVGEKETGGVVLERRGRNQLSNIDGTSKSMAIAA